jgi:hypothetical protein
MFFWFAITAGQNSWPAFSFSLGLGSLLYPFEVPLTVACSQLRVHQDQTYVFGVFYKDRR